MLAVVSYVGNMVSLIKFANKLSFNGQSNNLLSLIAKRIYHKQLLPWEERSDMLGYEMMRMIQIMYENNR